MPIEWLLYPALGVLAGLLAGLLGVGGGLVLVAALALLLPSQGVPAGIAMQAALATSLASVIVTAAASASAPARRGAASRGGGPCRHRAPAAWSSACPPPPATRPRRARWACPNGAWATSTCRRRWAPCSRPCRWRHSARASRTGSTDARSSAS